MRLRTPVFFLGQRWTYQKYAASDKGREHAPARLHAEQLETGGQWVRPGWIVGEVESLEETELEGQSFPYTWKIVSDGCLNVSLIVSKEDKEVGATHGSCSSSVKVGREEWIPNIVWFLREPSSSACMSCSLKMMSIGGSTSLLSELTSVFLWYRMSCKLHSKFNINEQCWTCVADCLAAVSMCRSSSRLIGWILCTRWLSTGVF